MNDGCRPPSTPTGVASATRGDFAESDQDHGHAPATDFWFPSSPSGACGEQLRQQRSPLGLPLPLTKTCSSSSSSSLSRSESTTSASSVGSRSVRRRPCFAVALTSLVLREELDPRFSRDSLRTHGTVPDADASSSPLTTHGIVPVGFDAVDEFAFMADGPSWFLSGVEGEEDGWQRVFSRARDEEMEEKPCAL